MSKKHPLFETDIPDGWQLLSVNDIKADEPSSCVAGPFGSSISSKYFVDEGVPVIRGSNLRDDLTRFVPNGFVFVSTEQAKQYKAQHVKADDLVFTCWGTLGQVGLIPKNGPYREYIISNKQLKLRPNKNISDPYFLFYYFASPQMVTYIKNMAIGAAVPGINLGILKSLPVVLPPLPIQRKIADVLSAYDDLIEVNTRRIRILEQMAQSVYREWFGKVDANAKSLPEGWKLDVLANHISVDRGISHKGAFMSGAGLPMLNLKSILAGGGYRTDGMKYYSGPYKPKQTVKPGDIILANTDLTQAGSIVGSPAMVPDMSGDILFTHHLYAVRFHQGTSLSKYYLYLLLLEGSFKSFAKGHAIGTTVLGLAQDGVLDYPFALPPADLLRKFEDLASPIYELRGSLEKKNANLRRTRDLLLPRLVRGEVAVHE